LTYPDIFTKLIQLIRDEENHPPTPANHGLLQMILQTWLGLRKVERGERRREERERERERRGERERERRGERESVVRGGGKRRDLPSYIFLPIRSRGLLVSRPIRLYVTCNV
jgi:hypothetical protein